MEFGDDNMFNLDFDYIEWDSDSQAWDPVDIQSYMETQVDLEQQVAQENQTFPKLARVKKVTPVPEKEVWSHSRLSDNVVSCSNTKYVRDAITNNHVSPYSYILLRSTDYAALRCGSKDFKYGAPCLILDNLQSCPGSISELGSAINEHFGLIPV